jgi:hypothetical protein
MKLWPNWKQEELKDNDQDLAFMESFLVGNGSISFQFVLYVKKFYS